MKMDLFVISDPHGHATLTKEALKNAGFDENDPKHLLAVNGDVFDRGPENRELYRYLDRIKNKVLIRGNHDDMLEQAIVTGKLNDLAASNGTEQTVINFFKSDYSPVTKNLYTDETAEGYKELVPFIDTMRDYFETENHIITHGWLPIDPNKPDENAHLAEDWRYLLPSVWKKARWTEWNKVYPYKQLFPKGKTVVAGHRSAGHASQFDPARDTGNRTVFYGNGVIAIDALTVLSGTVNVLVLRDEEIIPPAVRELTLSQDEFEQMRRGRKTVEIRPLTPELATMRVGDKIRFTCPEGEPSILTTAVGIYRSTDLRALTAEFPTHKLGYKDKTSAEATRALSLRYQKEEFDKAGAIAIRFSAERNQF